MQRPQQAGKRSIPGGRLVRIPRILNPNRRDPVAFIPPMSLSISYSYPYRWGIDAKIGEILVSNVSDANFPRYSPNPQPQPTIEKSLLHLREDGKEWTSPMHPSSAGDPVIQRSNGKVYYRKVQRVSLAVCRGGGGWRLDDG